MPKVRVAVGALVLLLAVPLADAAEGQLEAAAVGLAGPVALRAPSGDARWTGAGAPVLDVTAAKVHVERHGTRTESVAGGAFY
ncbi:MAG TPA: hypothetical protein VNX21_04530, partial [Candidatus Thermoplasmatota archaeon]|nr:hypothetical protein [Candidatus Thermoplasmatota archaeon]